MANFLLAESQHTSALGSGISTAKTRIRTATPVETVSLLDHPRKSELLDTRTIDRIEQELGPNLNNLRLAIICSRSDC